MKRKATQNYDGPEQIAVRVLAWLASDEDRARAFLTATGLAPGDLREAARDPDFLSAVLDHVVADEAALVACAASLDLSPERVAAAWRRLNPPEFDHGS